MRHEWFLILCLLSFIMACSHYSKKVEMAVKSSTEHNENSDTHDIKSLTVESIKWIKANKPEEYEKNKIQFDSVLDAANMQSFIEGMSIGKDPYELLDKAKKDDIESYTRLESVYKVLLEDYLEMEIRNKPKKISKTA